MTNAPIPSLRVKRIQTAAFAVGLLGLAAVVPAFVNDKAQFYPSYLVAYLFWTGISIGALGFLLLQGLVGGAWGFLLRRELEAGASLLALMAVMFVPFASGLPKLYSWANAEVVKGDALLQHKAGYLNGPFFLGRAAFYFAVWIGLAVLMSRLSSKQDETGDPETGAAMARWSAPGMVLFVLTVSFAGMDWVMSLQPKWFSSLYGALFMVGHGLSAMSFMAAVVIWLSEEKPVSEAASPGRLHDLGNLMLAFTMLWAYMSFSQFLLIWYGNLPEEISFYLRRMEGPWGPMALFLIVFHFFFPFFLLLFRRNKKNASALFYISLAILLVRFIDLIWQVKPVFGNAPFHWLDLAAWLGIGGLWTGGFFWRLQQRALLPQRDPIFPPQIGAVP